MKRFIQFTPIFIRHFSTMEWPFPLHNHNHLELMFIHRGHGIHHFNNQDTVYQNKCLFFLAPNDAHLFDIKSETEFSVLKFSYEYLYASDKNPSKWNKIIDELGIAKEKHNPILLSESALLKLEILFKLIVEEWEENEAKPTETMLPLLHSILILLQKNCSVIPNALPHYNDPLFIRVVRHIHDNIQQPDKISLGYLALHFKISISQLSRIFKTEMGLSIKHYIDTYRFRILENRLQYSSDLIKEISAEFGFTDVSHFNKFIKIQSQGLTPKELRSRKETLHKITTPSTA
ncbi:AraC family transcriptional regulator [Flavobacterium sp. HSC-61S13]|uniref:helix-turn-helix domain-containing protein n=1 Tax=Flavobacterium sp. HSC-61S13 TaxID=2910963 RepID=UPI00209E1DE1|nr:AraC family transcriptional regulator [Flavobacterium sp. HSC-61S13]MCP1996229.1 AraC-like DNA-binding protein [Flavobacterium sp. HSC-61S13]